MDDDENVDKQFSTQSARALRSTSDELARTVRDHAGALSELAGTEQDIQRVIRMNNEVQSALQRWDSAVNEHTGFSLILFDEYDDDDDSWQSLDHDDEWNGSQIISVVTRTDLIITDTSVGLEAAPTGNHTRLADITRSPKSTKDVIEEIIAVTHAVQDPLLTTPGINVVQGSRAYVVLSESYRESADNDIIPTLALPVGETIYTEDWKSPG